MNWFDFFTQITNMSLTASVIILFVLLFRRLFKNIPKVFSYVLWAVVLFRLISPVSFSSNISLLGMFDAPKAETTGITSSVEYVSPEIYVEYREVDAPTLSVSESTVVQAEPETKVSVEPMDIVIGIWLVGVLAMAGYSLVSYIKLKRRLMAVIPLRDNIYLADHIESAFVMGFIRPKIYLPSSLTEKEQEYIIMHEQHHIRRFDHVTKLLAFAALCVHWFNPLVWVAFVQSGKDMEMSCDEAVIKKMGEGIRAEYSASLLSLTMGRRIIAGTPLAFSEGNAKRRIINLANWKRPKTWVCIIVAISCILFTVACGTNPQSVVNPPKAEIEVENNTVNSGTESVANGTTVSDKAETVDEVKNEPIMENKGQNTYGTGPLVDDVPRPERNVLFKTVKTPYDFFSRVTLDDINDYYMHAGSWGDDLYTDDTENIDRLLGIMDGINEDDIKKMTVVPDFHEYDSDNDAYFDLLCDDVSVSVIYRGGEIYLAFHAHAAELGLGLEKTNPNLYRTYKWQLESEALVELFEEYIEAFGGKDDPQLVDLTNESFTVDGEDLLKYKFRTDLQMIILEIEDPNGEFIGEFTISSEGGGGYIRFVEMNEDEEQVYEMSAFPKYEYRIFGEDLEGCTVTLSSKNRF